MELYVVACRWDKEGARRVLAVRTDRVGFDKRTRWNVSTIEDPGRNIAAAVVDSGVSGLE